MSVFQQEGNRLKYHYDAEELWLELETATEEQFAAKAYKNGVYVATLAIRQ